MISAPIPPNEAERLAALRSYNIMDTAPERAYDDFTLLASRICGTPMALIGLIDETRQWYKSKVGLDGDECPRDITFCSHGLAMDPPGLMEVPDAREDARFFDNPAVTTGDAPVRFYAGAPLVTPERHVLGTLCVIDSTPRRLSPEQREALEALARQVAVQLELRRTQEKLAQGNLELRLLNAQKNQFLGMAAHDLRNPLQVIDGYGKLLLNGMVGAVTPAQEKALEAVTRNCAFMLGLVNDLLSISRIESAEIQLDRADLDLAALLRANVELNRLLADAKDIEIRLSLDAHLPHIRGDAFKIEQVLNNLISNAVKFSHRGSKVDVAARRNGLGAAISVKDQGQGIPLEEQHKLFRPFETTSVRGTAGEPSTGLGLSIAKRIVEAHGGALGVESAPGVGSTFEFTLPNR
jgi:signal transduction histidine kinase